MAVINLILLTVSILVSVVQSVERADEPGPTIQSYQGDNVEYECQDLSPDVDWYLNGNLIDREIHQRLRLSRNLIYIDSVHSEDGGDWMVKDKRQLSLNITDSSTFENPASCNFTLRVLQDHDAHGLQTDQFLDRFQHGTDNMEPPKFKRLDKMKRKQSAQLPVGKSVVFKCPAYGYPHPVIHWNKNGQDIPRQYAMHVKQHKWSLKLKSITNQDAGDYNCVASNLYGSVNFTYSLTVLEPKVLGMQNVTVSTGSTARLNCSMGRQRSTQIEWLRFVPDENGSFYDSTGAPYLQDLEVDYSNGRDRTILSIENVTREDNGQYLCKVVTKFGIFVQITWLSAVDAVEITQAHSDVLMDALTGLSISGAAVLLTIVSAYWIRRKCTRQNNRDGSRMMSERDSGEQLIIGPTKESIHEFPRENIVLGPRLGQGIVQAQARGIIASGMMTTVAVKILNENNLENLTTLVGFFKSVGKHKNIVNLLGYCTKGTPLYIIVEFAANGNLLNFLRRHRFVNNNESPPNSGNNVSYDDMVSFAHQVAQGMNYLGSRKVVHGYLAACNVLVDADGILKIKDYGISRDEHNSAKTAKWMAPESLLDLNDYTIQSDVWSFGILLWEIVSLGDCPYPGLNETDQLFQLICQGLRMEQPTGSSLELYKIMQNCWQHVPENRPTFDHLVTEFASLKEPTA